MERIPFDEQRHSLRLLQSMRCLGHRPFYAYELDRVLTFAKTLNRRCPKPRGWAEVCRLLSQVCEPLPSPRYSRNNIPSRCVYSATAMSACLTTGG